MWERVRPARAWHEPWPGVRGSPPEREVIKKYICCRVPVVEEE